MKEIRLAHSNYFEDDSANFDRFVKEVANLKTHQNYALTVEVFLNESISNQCFEVLFGKQRPNLISMKIMRVKLFSNSFRLFTEKRWEKLIHLELSKR